MVATATRPDELTSSAERIVVEEYRRPRQRLRAEEEEVALVG